MALSFLTRSNKRILEIKAILNDETRAKAMGEDGVTRAVHLERIERANRPLLAELEMLERKRTFIRDNVTVAIGIISIIIAFGVAFGVPMWQEYVAKTSDIQSIYQSITANGDIFIVNSSDLQHAKNSGKSLNLPESFIEIPINSVIQKDIQRKFGIDLYRYFLFYINQTRVLNEQVQKLQDEMASTGSIATSGSSEVEAYQASLKMLGEGSWEDSKFNYIHDTACLEYIFVKTYKFLNLSERDQWVSCSPESLNRVFYHFGYIEMEMPKWIRPELRKALNERETGLGDRLIKLN